MDVSLVIRQKLKELGLDQKELATAAGVTESYISQLLARKKAPPAPGRSEIYEKIGEFLGLPSGELSRLGELQRLIELKRRAGEVPPALNERSRELLLSKCVEAKREDLRRIFEKDAFGELERLLTQTMREAIGDEDEIESSLTRWDIDLKTFGLDLVVGRQKRRFDFLERVDETIESGFEHFRRDKSLSGDLTREEFAFLKALRFGERQPTAMFYYRALQNLRDPLHFKERA